MRKKIQTIIGKIVRFFEYRVVHVDDSAHRIALGVALGLFCAYQPFMGLHMVMVLFFCVLFKANKALGLLTVWVSNPFTLLIIYYPSYIIGRDIVNFFNKSRGVSKEQLGQMLNGLFDSEHSIGSFFSQLQDIFVRMGTELVVGGSLLGFAAGITGYVIVRKFIEHHRLKKPHRRFVDK